MKKARIIGAFIACAMAIAGVPAFPELASPFIVNAEAASKLAAPKNVKAAVNGSTVTLTWKTVKGADAYRVYKYNDSKGEYETLKNVSSAKCVVKGLSKGTYKFRVAALVKSGSKYKVQTKSSAVTAKVEGTTATTTTTASSGLPVAMPKLGTSSSAAIKAANLSNGMNMNYSEDVKAYMGYKKINGVDCMILLYFNSNDKYFYGAAVLTEDAVKSSTALANMRKTLGTELISQNNAGGSVYAWSDKTFNDIKALITVANGGSIYLEMDRSLVPGSMAGSSGGLDFNAITAMLT